MLGWGWGWGGSRWGVGCARACKLSKRPTHALAYLPLTNHPHAPPPPVRQASLREKTKQLKALSGELHAYQSQASMRSEGGG